MIKKEKKTGKILEDVLKTLSAVEDVEEAVIFTDDGEIIGHGDVPFAQASAFTMAKTKEAVLCFTADPLDEITLTLKAKRIIITRVCPGILLAVRVSPKAYQQAVASEASGVVRKIKELMK